MTYTGAQQRFMKKGATKKGQDSTPFVNMPFSMKKGGKSGRKRGYRRRSR